jgi:FKBP-type peptidyl-prolyl cis-trans isomerase
VEVQYARQTLTPPGLFEGLEGMKAGGRRVITIPAADAFGEEGNDALSMPAATDFIVVVDRFAAY